MHRDKRDVRREQSIQQNLTRSSLRLEGMLAGDQATPSRHAMAGEHVIRLAQAVESLPDDQATAIRLHHLEGRKLAEVAEQMQKTTASVAGLLHRGMKSLRQQISPTDF